VVYEEYARMLMMILADTDAGGYGTPDTLHDRKMPDNATVDSDI